MKKGIPASKGYAIGHAVVKNHIEFVIAERLIDDIQAEKERFYKAIEESKIQIRTIIVKTAKELGGDKAVVFQSHIMILEDPELISAVEDLIQNSRINCEKAIDDVIQGYLVIFESMDDEYMRERAADIKDVSGRLQWNLSGGKSSGVERLKENTIIVAHDLTPSDTAQLDRSKVIAFLTDTGGKTSHSAIMARTLEIPAVVGLLDITGVVKDGDLIIVDGSKGIVIINPSVAEIKEYEEIKEKFEKEREVLKILKNVKTVTKEGKFIEIAGNIGSPEDVDKVIENGGDGVGLFRTEFLYMDRDDMPSEEEQFTSYKYVLEKMQDKPVVIRTLDIGGDKKLSYLEMPEEMNPFLGYRAIRLCLDRKDIFKPQLRALLRASVYGNLKIMFPMISSLNEIQEAKSMLEQCRDELTREGYSVKSGIEVGIMIEIPAAAIMADELAKHVDFLSIGTNDLIQYTLAADRMNERVSYLYDPGHPAVLRLIKMTIDGAHKAGKWCGMCGEMAGDETYIKVLLEYGLDEFSMSASAILNAKKTILNI
jgi:phosphotransferase system enzyme I (PtsI)